MLEFVAARPCSVRHILLHFATVLLRWATFFNTWVPQATWWPYMVTQAKIFVFIWLLQIGSQDKSEGMSHACRLLEAYLSIANHCSSYYIMRAMGFCHNVFWTIRASSGLRFTTENLNQFRLDAILHPCTAWICQNVRQQKLQTMYSWPPSSRLLSRTVRFIFYNHCHCLHCTSSYYYLACTHYVCLVLQLSPKISHGLEIRKVLRWTLWASDEQFLALERSFCLFKDNEIDCHQMCMLGKLLMQSENIGDNFTSECHHAGLVIDLQSENGVNLFSTGDQQTLKNIAELKRQCLVERREIDEFSEMLDQIRNARLARERLQQRG